MRPVVAAALAPPVAAVAPPVAPSLQVDGVEVAPVEVASTRRARSRGLLGRDGVAGALWLPRTRSVHTIGMRFALDLLWLDAAGAVVRVDRDVAPRRLRTCVRARAVVEAAAGEGDRFAAALRSLGR